MRNFLDAIEITSMIQSIDRRREASVQAKDAVRDHRRHRKVVKGIGEMLPYVCVSIFSEALIVESVDLRDLSTLVVSSKDCDSISVSDFQGDEQSDRLKRVIASIDVVSHEEIIRLRAAVYQDTKRWRASLARCIVDRLEPLMHQGSEEK
jgi:hypothetical protein